MISVIIPVLNESERVRSVIEFAKAAGAPASDVGGAQRRAGRGASPWEAALVDS